MRISDLGFLIGIGSGLGWRPCSSPSLDDPGAECCRSDFQVGYPDRAQGHDAAAAERYRTANGASFSEVRGLSSRASDVPHGGPCAFWEVEQPAWRREKSRACQGFHAGCIKPWIRCAFYSAYRIPHSASG